MLPDSGKKKKKKTQKKNLLKLALEHRQRERRRWQNSCGGAREGAWGRQKPDRIPPCAFLPGERADGVAS